VQEYFREVDKEIADLRDRLGLLQAKRANTMSQRSEADVNE
jgi:hypothetical protein